MTTERWVDRHNDVWTLEADGLLHTPETRPFPREHVEKKWGPLRPWGEVAATMPTLDVRGVDTLLLGAPAAHPDWSAGFRVETTVALNDAQGLGLCIAELGSDLQAEFLLGLTEGLERLGTIKRGHQLSYISSHFEDRPGDAAVVAQLLRDLADFLTGRDGVLVPSDGFPNGGKRCSCASPEYIGPDDQTIPVGAWLRCKHCRGLFR